MDSPAIRMMWMRLLGSDEQCRMADERVLRNTVLLTATLERKLKHALPTDDILRSWPRMTNQAQRTVLADCVSVLSIPVASHFCGATRVLKMALSSAGTSPSLVAHTYSSLQSLRDVTPYQAVREAIVGIQLAARLKGAHKAAILEADATAAMKRGVPSQATSSYSVVNHRFSAAKAGCPELLHELVPYHVSLPSKRMVTRKLGAFALQPHR